jgi:hypothetical protein
MNFFRQILICAFVFVFSCNAFAITPEEIFFWEEIEALIIKDQVTKRLHEYGDRYSAFVSAPQDPTDPTYISTLNALMDIFSAENVTFTDNGPVPYSVTSFADLRDSFIVLKSNYQKGHGTFNLSNVIVTPAGRDEDGRRLANATYNFVEYVLAYYQGPGQTEPQVYLAQTVGQANTQWREEYIATGGKKWKETQITNNDQVVYGPLPYIYLRATPGYCGNTLVPAPEPCPTCNNPSSFQPVCP